MDPASDHLRSLSINPDDKPNQFRVRSLTLPVYLPNFLFSIGQGAAIPVIALLALDLGASPAIAGGVVALRGIGTMLFDVPSGLLVARFGERKAMVMATGVLALIAFGIGLRPSLPVYALLVLLMGCAWSVWSLARLAFATEATPPRHRGRVMSMMGGVNRTGNFVGPVLGSLVVIPFGLAGPFFIQAILAVGASLTLTATPERIEFESSRAQPISMRELLRAHRRNLGIVGFVAITVQVLRSARQAIIPLWGDFIGLDASQISLIFGASSALEMVVFYPVGALMDRKGRKWAALPCLLLLTVSMALIPLTSAFTSLLLVSLFAGFANGLGSGLNMTLGSDLSPALGRSQFLGLWRLVTDVGGAAGPLLIAVVTSLASLGAAPVVVAAVGLMGTAVLWRAVPETLGPDLE
ncbi:MAG: MFS transporter [Acidimicrobiia bacterium]